MEWHWCDKIEKLRFSSQLIESLGDSEALVTQTKAILMENDMTYEEFSQEIIQCLPLEEDKWKIPHEEYSKRLDLREKCIFTIDPATARDLDDALSCEALEGGKVEENQRKTNIHFDFNWLRWKIGLFRVGVHIADVSYFVQERTPLDNEASKRTTSVYLVDQVKLQIFLKTLKLCDTLQTSRINVDIKTHLNRERIQRKILNVVKFVS